MNFTLRRSISLIAAAMTCGFSSLMAQDLPSQTAAAEKIAAGNNVSEAAAKQIAADLAEAFGPQGNSDALLQAVEQMSAQNPANAPAIAAAATAFNTSPEFAARAAAAATRGAPSAAVAIAAAVTSAVPAAATAIAQSVSAVVPDQTQAVTDAVAQASQQSTTGSPDSGGDSGQGTAPLPGGFGGGGGGSSGGGSSASN